MEVVETQALSNFDLQSRSPCSSYMAIPSSDHHPQHSVIDAPGDVCSESRAAVKLQTVYRGYRTRRRLADSAVVAEELWWRAIDFARLSHSTVSFFNFSKPESVASRWNRVTLNASKVGKGLSKDSKAQKLAFQHWIEAIDPRHRYGHNLHFYYEEWRKTDAGQPFFYWLDIGDGKDVDLKECPRSKLRQHCIKYLGPDYSQKTGDFLDTQHGGKYIFVMSTSKKLYAGVKKKGIFHHSSFLAGGATIAAGRLVAEHGVLKTISAYSGHYRPTEDRLHSFLSFLKENGVNMDEVEVEKAGEEYSDSYSDGKTIGVESGVEASANPESTDPEMPKDEEENLPTKPSEAKQETKCNYERTLSGGLQSPRADVPKKSILQRINSKKAVNSYQLGHQLSLKWTTGAGPRIGCVADYPVELRVQALEFVNLSPRTPHTPPTPVYYKQITSPTSPAAHPIPDVTNSHATSDP